MSWLDPLVSELLGPFMDEGAPGAWIVGWIGLCWLVLPHWRPDGASLSAVLFAGVAMILAESAVRRVRRG